MSFSIILIYAESENQMESFSHAYWDWVRIKFVSYIQLVWEMCTPHHLSLNKQAADERVLQKFILQSMIELTIIIEIAFCPIPCDRSHYDGK